MRKPVRLMSLVASPLLAALVGLPVGATGLQIEVEGEGANGTIVIDLLEDVAPGHVAQIAALAAEGAYDDVVFHRVIEGFMAQTGDVQYGKMGADMRRAGTGGSDRPDLAAEFSDVPYERGVVGMARAQNPNSANSQFFIMFAPGAFLNGQYTVVGRVTEGMDVVDQIKLGTGPNGAVVGQPDRMVSVTVIE
jgi:peptidylprolyl isomerase